MRRQVGGARPCLNDFCDWKRQSFQADSLSVARPLKISAAQTDVLLRGVAAAQRLEALAPRRLAALFPELAARLEVALKATRAQRRNAALACRHYLCAEALVEVLEARSRDGRGRKGDARGEIVDEYGARAAAKLRAFSKRPATERRIIQLAYPEVDLPLVRRALVRGDLSPEFVAGVLEDPVNYDALVRQIASSSRRRI